MESGSASRPKVLVVEPDNELAEQLCSGLAREGILAKAAQNKEQASIRAEIGADVVLLDFDTPDPAGLIALIRAVENTRDASIIALTSGGTPAAAAAALQAGADDCIGKPEIVAPRQNEPNAGGGLDLSVALARIRREFALRDAEAGACGLELQVAELQERLTLILSGTNDGVWDWDLRDNKIHYSPRWREISGCPNAVLTDSPEEWLSRVHPDCSSEIRQDLQAHWNDINSREFQTEYRMISDDGSYRWLVCRAVTLRDSTGQPLRMAGSQADVTRIRAFDFLTGLPNRLWLTEILKRVLDSRKKSAHRPSNVLAVICLGLDRFRSINEAFGHSLGDELLLAVARRLQSSVRSAGRAGVTDIVARLGGDEFALVLSGAPSSEAVLAIAERVLANIGEPFMIQGREIFTSASAGVALADEYCSSPDDLLRDADIARNQAKGLGRARCIVYDQQARVALIERADLENDLRHAVARNELRLFYQPIVSIADARPVGFEALVRWKHPVRGMIPPIQFVPLAEETGLIVPIGAWILNEACRKARWWHDLGYPLEVNVNLSPRQLRDGRFVHTVEQALLQSNLMPAALHLEITENLLIENFPEAKECLSALKRMGVGIKIDDFGVGYSSLGYLHRFQVDALKIDRSFVNDMSKDQACLGIVRTVVLLARGLGVKVVAEGVETQEQAAQLMTLGCELAQGYYFKKPMPSEELLNFLEHSNSMALAE